MMVQDRADIADHRHATNAPITRAAVSCWCCGVAWRGVLVHEQNLNGFSRNTMGPSFSVAKSVVSLLVGVAVADGRIVSVDDLVTRYLPELATFTIRPVMNFTRHQGTGAGKHPASAGLPAVGQD